jgi:hypothetical protein
LNAPLNTGRFFIATKLGFGQCSSVETARHQSIHGNENLLEKIKMLAGLHAGSRQEEKRAGQLSPESKSEIEQVRKRVPEEAAKTARSLAEGTSWQTPQRGSTLQVSEQDCQTVSALAS